VTATVNGSVQALVFQRGEVTAVSATSIALKSSDGFVGTYARTAATTSRGAALVTGGQALVLARASDKVAITMMSTQANAAVPPSN
jgi:ethanolamine utilization microcompartment shell protein EutL